VHASSDITGRQRVSVCTEDVTTVSIVVLVSSRSKMRTIWGYERVMWVETWVNSGNDDMSKHETAQGGCQRYSGSIIRDTAVLMEKRTER
jgi:hypothetical protein